MVFNKRSIRLKEWGVNRLVKRTPDDDYLENRKGVKKKEYLVSTDKYGFIRGRDERGREGRIVFLGDSFVESLFVDEEKRFHINLEDKLYASGFDISCLNAGYSGATSLHLLNVSINKVIPLFPRCVFFVVPSNDSVCLGEAGGYWSSASYLSPFVSESRSRESIRDEAGTKQEFKNIIKATVRLYASFGVKVVICTFPHRHESFHDEWNIFKFKTESNFKRRSRKRLLINEAARELAISKKYEIIDLEKKMQPFGIYSQDDLHMDEAGSSFLAEIIFKHILKNI